ncbi:MAG: hydroxymethylglutaryl-CoA lyase [Acidobacteria bacterium]|nr:hydroxymethylglutaryl-CoA lyase [Acidobacteriota bacterium]MBI3663144.1 hydroxymethylglutaryl-CoA lyase [Acidobacteriota bacterium]
MTTPTKLIECPRDAWQGLTQVIPAEEKVAYHRALIAAGFGHIDAVSFVSPKYVPQMADSEEVMGLLQTSLPPTSLLSEIIGIVVNEKGMERALATPGVTTLGYPYSISAHFRQANARMTRAESRALVERLRAATKAAGRSLVVYISMAFGNNYGEPWGPEIIEDTLIWLKDIGVRTVSLADTIGTASPNLVGSVFNAVKNCVAGIELGVHLHSRPDGAAERVLAAYEAGCRRFDSALTGLGGCPFAGDDLVGNIPTEIVVHTLAKKGVDTGIAPQSLGPVLALTHEIRTKYAH